MSNVKINEAITQITRDLTDQGRVMEAGWVLFRDQVVAETASDDQLREMKLAFFAGAHHLFGSIMTVLQPGAEPTTADMRRLTNISKELLAFGAEYTLRNTPTEGRG